MNQNLEKPKRNWRRLFLVIAALGLVVGLAGYFLPFSPLNKAETGEKQGEATLEKQGGKKKTFTLDSFVVNLADADYRRYLRVTLTLEYCEPELEKELLAKKHRIRDVVIEVLRSKKIADLGSGGQTDALRKQLQEAINQNLTQGKIEGLYFEEFLVQ